MNRTFLFFISLVFCSCNIDKNTKNEVSEKNAIDFITIDFSKALANSSDIQLSDIATNVEYIPLESHPDYLLGRIDDAIIAGDFIFIKDNRNPILQFRLDGSFVRTIGKLGRGPGEYFHARCFSINEDKAQLYIHSGNQEIVIYDFAGKYMGANKLESSETNKIVWSRDSLFLHYTEGGFDISGLVFCERDAYGDMIQSVNNYYNYDKMPAIVFITDYFGRNTFYRYKNHLHFKSWYNDTIYSYNHEKEISPKYLIDLKHFKLPERHFYNKTKIENPKDFYWFGIQESERYIFINYSSYALSAERNPGGYVLYDKVAGLERSVLDNVNGFKDDYGYPFIPRFVNDTIAFDFANAYEFLDAFSDKIIQMDETSVMINKLRNINGNSNPILIIAKLRD
jgi:hypothetical protein